MSLELGRRLLASAAVPPADVEAALHAHVQGRAPFVRALLDRGALTERALEAELARADVPVVKNVVPVPGVLDELPAGMCRRLLALPVRRDPRTGTVDVAAVDPFDSHLPAEFAFHVGTAVRMLRAPLAAIEDALRRIERGEHPTVQTKTAPPPPPPPPHSTRRLTPAFPLGAPTRQSEPPIPLVRRSSIVPSPELLEGRDIVSQTEPDGTVTDDQGQPILSLRMSKPPKSMSIPAEPAIAHAPPVPELASPGPYTPDAPRGPFPAIDDALDALRSASSRDEVIARLISGMTPVARRVALFVVKKAEYQGWACNEAFGDEGSLRTVRIPAEAPSVLATAVATGSYLGQIPLTPTHMALLAAMRGRSGEAAALPVRVSGHPALVILIDELGDTLVATRRATELGRVAGESLSRILADRGPRR